MKRKSCRGDADAVPNAAQIEACINAGKTNAHTRRVSDEWKSAYTRLHDRWGEDYSELEDARRFLSLWKAQAEAAGDVADVASEMLDWMDAAPLDAIHPLVLNTLRSALKQAIAAFPGADE